ncbi:hypothetical protein ASG17_10925 [Brevundimonas sp. Leaf363]|uniref:hypothetical protein n=1 Tax=Brevundimonas sp. Leaf363 TaxID=1736353 RepID=UPI0007138AB8|nr:hypothetical protein [Brevundimonas sp. Leaf363]KQS56490.1 hypothetical protein ASG17_10925 [Brevundimonas sp. Leaf363]
MKVHMLGLAGMLALTLAGCGNGGDAATDPAAAEAPVAATGPVLSGEGLVIGSDTIAFGSPAAAAVQAVTAAMGSEPVQTANADCPTGATEDFAWGDKLAILTRDGAFIGWHSSQAGPATASGVRTGDTRTKAETAPGFEMMESQFEQPMFGVDGVYGFLNADSQSIGVLYAGDTCIAS